MSKNGLLLDEQPLIILPQLATAIGLNEAIVLQQIHYWLELNKKAKLARHHHKDRWWTYNTLDQWKDNFPFWSRRTVRRTLDRLRERGLILRGNFNLKGYDQTLWYTIQYDRLDELATACGQDVHMEVDNLTTSKRTECPDGSGQDDHMQVDELDTPIPETSTESNPESSTENVGADAPVSPPTSEADNDLDPEEVFTPSDHKRNGEYYTPRFHLTDDPAFDMVAGSDLKKKRGIPDWAIPGPEGPDPAFPVIKAFCELTGQSVNALTSKRGTALLRHYTKLSGEHDLSADHLTQAHKVLRGNDWGEWYLAKHKWRTGYEDSYAEMLVLAASQIRDGRLEIGADGKATEKIPDEILAQGTGYAAIMAHQRLKEKAARERGEEVPKSMWPSLRALEEAQEADP